MPNNSPQATVRMTGCEMIHEMAKNMEVLTLVTTSFDFFLPMEPPTVTDQQHRIKGGGKGKRAIVYDSPELADAKSKLKAHLTLALQKLKRDDGYEMIVGKPIFLRVAWCFPIANGSKHVHGEYKITKPDTDNMQKALKDCMTKVGFWKDDALVVNDLSMKLYSDIPGLWIQGGVLEHKHNLGISENAGGDT